MASKKQRQAAEILKHGQDLLAIFPAARVQDPVLLCKRLRRLEGQAEAAAVAYCNGDMSSEAREVKFDKILAAVQDLLQSGDVPVFINGDPRGYALKIDDEHVKRHNLTIHRDWGGYGILAPEITG